MTLIRSDYFAVASGYKEKCEKLEQQNADLVAALEEGCKYHDLPLKKGKFHVLNPGKGKLVKWVDCELSEQARKALAQVEKNS